jgi:hypothetical protein
LHQGGAQPAIAFGGAAGASLARALFVTRAHPGPGREVLIAGEGPRPTSR